MIQLVDVLIKRKTLTRGLKSQLAKIILSSSINQLKIVLWYPTAYLYTCNTTSVVVYSAKSSSALVKSQSRLCLRYMYTTVSYVMG